LKEEDFLIKIIDNNNKDNTLVKESWKIATEHISLP
jgi:hypothetical protein